ncbi:conserved protein, unknown function [Hepatocystis sp. ex Piliocolobus tephrosceles]|nr:conserved protein, unknown function [Hepatocystis sp. ex Piliocolobus tephrosceles]
MMLKKIYNGHFRRIPISEKEENGLSNKSASSEDIIVDMNENKAQYGLIDNIICGAGLGVGAIGFSLAVISSTVIASTVAFSSLLCANTCKATEDILYDETN